MFLYLRRSFQRRPLRHFSLFWILVCAFLLPLVISVYRDSLAYGAVPAAVFPFLIAIPWALLDSHRSGRPFIVSVPVVGIYLSIAVLAAASFYLPIRITMGKILKQIK